MTLYGLYAKRYKMTFGYVAFYALLFAALNFGVVAILGRYGSYFPFAVADYLSNDMMGVSYVYTLVALALTALSLFLSPNLLRLDAIFNNRWYLLSKCGYTLAGMVSCRILVALIGLFGAYLIGFVLSLGVGSLLLFSFDVYGLVLVARIAAIGMLCILCLVLVPMALSSVLHPKIFTALGVLLAAGGLGFYLTTQGFFYSAAQDSLQLSIEQLTGFSIPCLLLIVAVLSAASVIVILLRSKARIHNYEEPELDEEALIALGIEADTLVLEQGAHKYDIVISGPDINDDEREIEIPRLSHDDVAQDAEPFEEDAPVRKRGRAVRPESEEEETVEQQPDETEDDDEAEKERPRRRGLFGRRREEDAEDIEEDDEDDADEDEEEERPRRRGLFGRRRNDADDEDDEDAE